MEEVEVFFKLRVSNATLEQKDATIMEGEMRAAILCMKIVKSPGLDGFPIEYFNKYIDISSESGLLNKFI